jgi:hypothetical protein
MLFPARKKPRKFSYTPQYLKEEKNYEYKEKRIKLRRTSRYIQKKGFPIWLIILVICVVFIIIYLTNIGR